MPELRYFVKWKGCSEDENTWEPPESLENAQELREGGGEGEREYLDILKRSGIRTVLKKLLGRERERLAK